MLLRPEYASLDKIGDPRRPSRGVARVDLGRAGGVLLLPRAASPCQRPASSSTSDRSSCCGVLTCGGCTRRPRSSAANRARATAAVPIGRAALRRPCLSAVLPPRVGAKAGPCWLPSPQPRRSAWLPLWVDMHELLYGQGAEQRLTLPCIGSCSLDLAIGARGFGSGGLLIPSRLTASACSSGIRGVVLQARDGR